MLDIQLRPEKYLTAEDVSSLVGGNEELVQQMYRAHLIDAAELRRGKVVFSPSEARRWKNWYWEHWRDYEKYLCASEKILAGFFAAAVTRPNPPPRTQPAPVTFTLDHTPATQQQQNVPSLQHRFPCTHYSHVLLPRGRPPPSSRGTRNAAKPPTPCSTPYYPQQPPPALTVLPRGKRKPSAIHTTARPHVTFTLHHTPCTTQQQQNVPSLQHRFPCTHYSHVLLPRGRPPPSSRGTRNAAKPPTPCSTASWPATIQHQPPPARSPPDLTPPRSPYAAGKPPPPGAHPPLPYRSSSSHPRTATSTSRGDPPTHRPLTRSAAKPPTCWPATTQRHTNRTTARARLTPPVNQKPALASSTVPAASFLSYPRVDLTRLNPPLHPPFPGLRPPNDTPTTPPLRSPYPRGKPRNRRAPPTLQLPDKSKSWQVEKLAPTTTHQQGSAPPSFTPHPTAQAHPHARLLIPPHARRSFLLSLPPPVTVIAQCSHSTLQSLHNAITPHLYPAVATGEQHHRLARPRHPNPIPFSYPGVNQKPAALLPTSATRDHPHP